jgi:interferon gamma-inducible protein 30
MKIILLISLILLAFSDDRVNIDVYTESLCPDCVEFLEKSFKNAIGVKDFEKICNFRILPYGNAKQQ